MRDVLVFQHHPNETIGIIAESLAKRNLSPKVICPFKNDKVPSDLGSAAALIVMGGPMGVYEAEKYPYLLQEMQLIKQAIQKEKPVLGICLGSQLLASALGAEIKPGPRKEIGWQPVYLKGLAEDDAVFRGVPDSFIGFHWHGDIFDLPKGALPLAASGTTDIQAFRYGRNAYGVLFHLEVTETILEGMTKSFTEELREENISAVEMRLNSREFLPDLQRIGRPFFDRWVGLI
jgi:GMP synthase (glutamine-hydrolysing)